MEMTSKERIIAALNHEEPDRVPVDLGGWVTSISKITYNKVLNTLGVNRQTPVFDWLRQNVAPEEDVLQRLGIDTRYVHPGNPHSWSFLPRKRQDGFVVVDEWGCGFIKPPTSLYYNLNHSPLQNAKIDDLDSYPWPNPRDPGYLEGVEEQSAQLHAEGQYAVVGNFAWETWFERAWKLRGMETFFMDIALNKEFVHALLDKTLGIHLEFLDNMLSVSGHYLDVVIQGADLGAQQTTLISPQDYEEFIKPRQKRAIDLIRKKTNAKIFWHSCGAVSNLIPHFIEIGIDIINPVQVRAKGMDAHELKIKYGRDIAFWGGVDSQQVMPRGTPKEVEDEVRHIIRNMAGGGGLVVSAVHNIQADVPPENVLALFDSAKKWGEYPLAENLWGIGKDIMEKVSKGIRSGKAPAVIEALDALLGQGHNPLQLLDLMVETLREVGDDFSRGKAFIPEMLIAARATKAGIDRLKPFLTSTDRPNMGKFMIATVSGDLHDIGKNLVAVVFKGNGFKVVDLGIDVSIEKIISSYELEKPHIVGLSALLTTTMPAMEETISALKERHPRAKVIVGGAPITQEYSDEIGADGFAPDAYKAVEVVKRLMSIK
jgi:uroporphyrinogen decarboxylase